MKKLICLFICIVMVFSLCSCGKSVCKMKGSFFTDKDERFILVDMGKDLGNRNCYVYADTATGCMYLVGYNIAYNSTISFQLMNNDGTPMIYDEDYIAVN